VPVLYSDGKLTELGSLGGMSGGAYDINDRGQIAGASATGTGSGGAFVFSDGRMTSLGTTTNTLPYSMALGINNHGSVVGAVYDLGALVSHAFLYKDGQMIDLNAVILDDSGLVLDQAVGINDSGEIIASGNYGDGQGHGFLLKPVHRVGKKGTREAPDRVMPSTSEAQF
jgi:probable HAF family extracellular repeat protein